MPPPTKRSGDPGHHPQAAANKISAATKPQDQGQDSRTIPFARELPIAVGEFYPPAGRRHLGVVVVRSCPACLHLHLHRANAAGSADGTTRTGSCGAEYRLRVLPGEHRRVA